MLIRNSKNWVEYEAKRAMAMKLLEVEAENEAYLDKKVSTYRDPNAPAPVPPRYRDASEIAKDELGNQLRMTEFFKGIGFSEINARALVNNIVASGNGNDKILKLLQSSGNLKRKLSGYDPKLINVQFVGNVIEKFLESYDKTLGGVAEDSLELLVQRLLAGDKYLPEPEQIHRLIGKFSELKRVRESERLPTAQIDNSIDSLNKYISLISIVEKSRFSEDKSVSDKMSEIESLLKSGRIPTKINIEFYIQTVSDLLIPSATGGRNIEDDNNTLQRLNSVLDIDAKTVKLVEELGRKLSIPGQNAEAILNNLAGENVRLAREQKVYEDKFQNESEEKYYLLVKDWASAHDRKDWAKKVGVMLRPISKKEGGSAQAQILNHLEKLNEEGKSWAEIYADLLKIDGPAQNQDTNTNKYLSKNAIVNGQNAEYHQVETEKAIQNEMLRNPKAVEKSSRDISQLITGITATDYDLFLKGEQGIAPGETYEAMISSLHPYGLSNNSNVSNNQSSLKFNFVPEDDERAERLMMDSSGIFSKPLFTEADKQRLIKEGFMLSDEELQRGQQSISKTGEIKRVKQPRVLMGSELKENRKQVIKDLIRNLTEDEKESLLEKLGMKPNTMIGNNALYNVINDLINSGEYSLGQYGIGGFGVRQPIKKGRGKSQIYGAPEDLLKYTPKSSPYDSDLSRRAEEIADETFEQNYKVKQKLGMGQLGFKHKKIKVGSGIAIQEEPKFVMFGKYLLNKPHLYNDSKFTLRFPSGGGIPTLKPISISDDFREFLIDLIENSKPDEKLYKSVPTNEKLYFQKAVKGAGLVHQFGIKPIADDSDKKDADRYKLLLGELQAGNNNKDLVKELRALIIKFINNGRMKVSEGQSLLYELSVI